MPRGKKLKVAFKANHQHQIMAFPPTLDELVAAGHPVRTVNDVLERIDISALVAAYSPAGASAYHPRMLLKALVFAYINNIYSSRRIEEAIKENIHFMWLTGMSKPDHNTINRFRGQRLQKTLQPIFTQVVMLLCEEGLLSLKELYTDGTKIEASANRYTFVWGRAMKTSRERIKEQLNDLWKYAQSVAASELDDTDPSGFDKIDSRKVTETIEKINEALRDKAASSKIRQKLNYARRHWPEALDKYERQEKLLGSKRSSYSRTDPDATFMRMKEDHMRNGQLKPGYNVQISTNNQFIASYSLHQDTTDSRTLIPHVKEHIRNYGIKPANVTADAGYGSQENYEWLEGRGITAYVKHNQFDRQQKERIKSKTPYATDKLVYDADKDVYLCPVGKEMVNIGEREKANRSGFKQTHTHYRAKKCAGCPLKDQCHPGQGNRVIEVNHAYRRLRLKAEKRLKTKRGIQKRKQRCFDVEPVFAQIKHNHHFKRFLLRGLDKVSVEMGLLALAHNLRKRVAA
jgi:radical SAM protein with 4Fe4S-binding SPASM domain